MNLVGKRVRARWMDKDVTGTAVSYHDYPDCRYAQPIYRVRIDPDCYHQFNAPGVLEEGWFPFRPSELEEVP